MRHPNTLFLATLAIGLVGAEAARAEFISWSYSWTGVPAVITSDNNGTGQIVLQGQSGQPTTQLNSPLVGPAVLATFSSQAPANNPDHFTDKTFTLSLTLTDGSSGAQGTLNFTGFFQGTLSKTTNHVMTTVNRPLAQFLLLGQHMYAVVLSPLVIPPRGGLPEIFEAAIDVSNVATSPEPSTLVLASATLPFLALALWRRRPAVFRVA
jgi:hypothetical protein